MNFHTFVLMEYHEYLDTWKHFWLLDGLAQWSPTRVWTRDDESVGGLSRTRGVPPQCRRVKHAHLPLVDDGMSL